MIRPIRTAPPATIIDMVTARAHLRIEDSGHDSVIAQYLAAALDRLDGWNGILGRCLAHQNWQSFHPALDSRCGVLLPFPGADQIVAVEYLDPASALQPLDPVDFRIEDGVSGARLVPRSSAVVIPRTENRPDAWRITARYGWEVGQVPASLRQALLLLLSHYFENRSATAFGGGFGQLPIGVDALISPWRGSIMDGPA